MPIRNDAETVLCQVGGKLRANCLHFRSDSTVQGWFKRGKNRRFPTAVDLRHLAVMDFLLEHFEEIPDVLANLLCPHSEDKKGR